jgi:hypothetical protein
MRSRHCVTSRVFLGVTECSCVCGYFEWQACNTNVVQRLLETSLSSETVEENLTFIGETRSV